VNNHIYILSGLGADDRVFSRINFPENHTHLVWIENKPNESLQGYAARMAQKIEHPNPIIIGLSFGGIVAQEIAAIISVKEVILISTIRSLYDSPWYFNLAGKLGMIHLIPNLILAKPNIFVAYAFSLTAGEDKTVLNSCFDTTTSAHIKWALKHIAKWKGLESNTPIFQIHSRQDRIFTSRKSLANTYINGGHFAVYTNASEINEILSDRFN
jgi:pimeloyl-ACP methyl ester carboxylesterase